MRSIAQVCQEADRFFMHQSPVHQAAEALSKELRRLEIPYAIAGALSANAHGHTRTTADVDVLLRREDLKKFKRSRLGLGYVELFVGSKGMRDTEHNVKIDVLLSGEFPGDGKPKPVAFPDPIEAGEPDVNGVSYLKLSWLMQLKLASGMTAAHRPQDLYDVIQLIRVNQLSVRYGQELPPYVRDKYAELWALAQVDEDY